MIQSQVAVEIWVVRILVWAAGLALGVIRGAHSYQKPKSSVAFRQPGATQPAILAVSLVGFIVPIIWASTSWLHEWNYAANRVVQFAGVAVIAVGLHLFNRTHADIGRNWSSTLQIVEGQELITSGIYARVRHPMYLSLLLFALGQALLIPNVFAGPACLIGCGVLAGLRMRDEEAMLRARFGQAYEDYASQTPALLPRGKRPRSPV